jgi:3-phytase
LNRPGTFVQAAGRFPHTSRMQDTRPPLLPATLTAILPVLLLVASCAGPGKRSDPPPALPIAVADGADAATVPERYVSVELSADELDSLAVWPTPEGGLWLLATGKAGHRLTLFDAASGRVLRTVGGRGQGQGQFLRPNGVAVFGDHVFVTERDNRRVQVLRLPGFEPAGTFGEQQLRSPYGLWLHEVAPGELEAFVTDSFMYGERFDVVPPVRELDQRVRRYRVRFDPSGMVQARYAGAFGDTGEGALRMVESIAGDPANDRLLIADEYRDRGSTLREYTLSGRYTGRSLPAHSFAAEAEGVALWACREDGDTAASGYWIAVDQLSPLTTFHVFERGSLALAGSFRGETTSWTDGIALHAAGTPEFPFGALFAVHADKAVTAFDLGEIVRVLGLSPACLD